MLGIPDAEDLAQKVLMIIKKRALEEEAKLAEMREAKDRQYDAEDMIRRLASEGYGYTEIAHELNKAGMKSTLGGKFYPGTVRNYTLSHNIRVSTLYKRGRKPGSKFNKR